jgi:hypothetical protein
MSRRLALFAATVAAAVLGFAAPVAAEAHTVGAHLVSVHIPGNLGRNNTNTGLSYRHDSGAMVGFFRNSINRTSVYAAYQFPIGPFDVAVGATTGYKEHCRITETGSRFCSGYSPKHWTPLVVPSYALPAVAGFVPRVSAVYGPKSTALHLSVERSF